jgi:lipopolysaccharide export system permease protein
VEVERRGRGPDYPSLLAAAPVARYRAPAGPGGAPGRWTLERGTLHVLPADSVDLAFRFDSLVDRRMTERPRDLMVTPKAPEDMDYRELGRFIAALERSGADVNALKVARMLKVAIPVTCVIILLFGAPLATSTQRGGAAFGVGLSLGTTIVFLILIQLTKAVGGKGLIPPELAAWIPSALFGLAGAILLARTRT